MTNYKLNDEKMFSDVTDDIAIIINSETGIYYGLNAFATNVFENIINGVSVEKILEKIKTFKNAPASIEVNFKEFINSMVDKEIFIETQNENSDANLDENIAQKENFRFELKEYDDAKELLLADPIHEVKEETGWTPEKSSIGYTKEETKKREEKMEK